MTLTEFLLARIAEDQADVRGHVFDYAPQDTGIPHCRHESHRSGYSPTCWRAHVSARVLDECWAKRTIAETAAHERAQGRLDGVVQVLAMVYASHPDWREEWRP